MSLKRPDFIIVGAMKCATSTLHDQLSQQEPFFMTTPKEPYFFSDDEVYKKGTDWYGDLFENAKPGQIKGESSTHYTKLPRYPDTIYRMKAFCPDVKIIYVMRDPIERLISQYIHEWTETIISCGIDKAIYKFPQLIDYSKYHMQINPYLEAFGKNMVLPIFFEWLKNNPVEILEMICRFLQLDFNPVWHETIHSNVSSERLRKSKWRDLVVKNKQLTFIRRNFIPKKFRNKVRRLWTYRERPELSEESLKYLTGTLNQDLALLSAKLGVQLDCKNFKHVVTTNRNLSWL